MEGRRCGRRPHPAADAGAADRGELAGGYDDMVQALADRLPARLQAETDPSGAARR